MQIHFKSDISMNIFICSISVSLLVPMIAEVKNDTSLDWLCISTFSHSTNIGKACNDEILANFVFIFELILLLNLLQLIPSPETLLFFYSVTFEMHIYSECGINLLTNV